MNKTMALKSKKQYLLPIIIISVMFFVIGFGIGISGFLIPALKSAFNLSSGQSYLVTVAIFSAFVIFGRPAGWLIKIIGYRRSMTYAFFIMSMGMFLFIPSATYVSFPLFLFALFVGGIGNTLLQAAVNPYVTIVGPKESAAMRMCLMGIMNKTAWWIAPLFLGIFIDLQKVNLNDIVSPFYMVGGILIFLGIFTYFSPLPEVKAEGEDESESESEILSNRTVTATDKTSILQFPHLLLGTLALFLYVGIETLPMASIIDFAKACFGDAPNLEGYSKFVTIGLVSGYIIGVLTIPKFISQTKALALFAFIGIASSVILVIAPPKYAFIALLFTSFANSVMWPAIWPLAIADLGRFTKSGASLLVMAIVGGAVIPYLFGLIVDLAKGVALTATIQNYQLGYTILIPGYLFILYFALFGYKIRTK